MENKNTESMCEKCPMWVDDICQYRALREVVGIDKDVKFCPAIDRMGKILLNTLSNWNKGGNEYEH